MALGYQARWYPNYTQRLKVCPAHSCLPSYLLYGSGFDLLLTTAQLPESMMNFFIHDDIEIMANFASDAGGEGASAQVQFWVSSQASRVVNSFPVSPLFARR